MKSTSYIYITFVTFFGRDWTENQILLYQIKFGETLTKKKFFLEKLYYWCLKFKSRFILILQNLRNLKYIIKLVLCSIIAIKHHHDVSLLNFST